jgi:hypothetical protein
LGLCRYSRVFSWSNKLHLSCLDASGNPYVAYRDVAKGFKTKVSKFTGSSWIDLGSTGISVGQAIQPSIALNSIGTPFVAYVDRENFSRATVKKFNGTSWIDAGAAGFSEGIVNFTSLSFDGSGTAYLAYGDGYGINKATIKRFNGTSWEDLEPAGLSAGFWNTISLAIQGNNLFIAYSNPDLFAKIYNLNNTNAAPTGISISATAINENVAANTLVGTFSSIDPDLGNTHSYMLVSGIGSSDNAVFTLSGNALSINSSPDFETKSSYSIRVQTTDQGGLYFENAFVITINDVNEATVVLSATTLNENVQANSTIGT